MNGRLKLELTSIRIRRGDCRLQATGESPPPDVDNSEHVLPAGTNPGRLT
jgi:hypothetical protein